MTIQTKYSIGTHAYICINCRVYRVLIRSVNVTRGENYKSIKYGTYKVAQHDTVEFYEHQLFATQADAEESKIMFLQKQRRDSKKAGSKANTNNLQKVEV